MQNMMMQETSLTRKIFKSKQDSLHFERKKTNQLDKDFAIINFVHVRSLLPTSQLTTHRNKKEKEKKREEKGEEKLVTARQKSHPGFRSAIDYRFTGR